MAQNRILPLKQTNDFNMQSELQTKVEKFELNEYGSRYGGINKDITFSQTVKNGRQKLYINLPYNHRSIMNPEKHIDNLCVIWPILAKIIPVPIVSLINSYVKHFKKIKFSVIDFTDGSQIKDFPRLENLNDLCRNVLLLHDRKLTYEVASNPLHVSKMNKESKNPLDSLLYTNH